MPVEGAWGRLQRDGQVLPGHQVLALGMAPDQSPLPLAAVWHVLAGPNKGGRRSNKSNQQLCMVVSKASKRGTPAVFHSTVVAAVLPAARDNEKGVMISTPDQDQAADQQQHRSLTPLYA